MPQNEAGDEKEANDDLYSEKGREELIEGEDEITAIDEGFMRGYDEGERVTDCANCARMLPDHPIEEEFAGEMHFFCSSSCAEEYGEKRLNES